MDECTPCHKVVASVFSFATVCITYTVYYTVYIFFDGSMMRRLAKGLLQHRKVIAELFVDQKNSTI